MFRKLLLFTVVLATATAFSQTKQQLKQAGPADPAATTNCLHTFTSGSGSPSYLQFCVTANGNIVELQSPQNFEHIRVGVILEGYGVCDIDSGTRYTDFAAAASSNWNPALVSGSSLPMTITRTTSDGIWTLKQVINRNATDPAVTITMSLKNNTGSSRPVGLLRYADVDANNQTSNEWFDFDHESAWGYQSVDLSTIPPPPSTNKFGVMAYASPTSTPHFAFIQDTFEPPDPCAPNANVPSTPWNGDGSVGIEWVVTVPADKSVTYESEYRRF